MLRREEGMERWRGMFLLLLLLSVAISVAAVLAFDRQSARDSLLDLTNLVGPTAASLLAGRGLTACTVLMGTPGNPICFHGGRMPVPTLVVAAGVRLLGDHFIRVALAKTLLMLLPLELGDPAGVWPMAQSADGGWRRWVVEPLLLLPFGITAFLADVVNLQVEEGYTYSLLALAVAVVLFRDAGVESRAGWLRPGGVGEAMVFGAAVAGLYLAKSAMAPAAAVLLIGYVRRVRGVGVRWLAVVLVMAAPLGWAGYQRHATGRASLGTSIDGLNLHKGNDAEFLRMYPPRPGTTLDGFDTTLNAGMHFGDEWSFNDFHKRAAVDFAEGHPWETVRGGMRKVEVIFVSIEKYGSNASHGVLRAVEMAGMVVFRVMLWTAIGVSVAGLVWGWGGLRAEGVVFLLLVAAVALPYVAGFAYTRHVSVLIYPAALMCSRALMATMQKVISTQGLH